MTIDSRTVYRLLWVERGNPENTGEGLPVADAKEANEIVRKHNINYPRFRHWAERAQFQFHSE